LECYYYSPVANSQPSDLGVYISVGALASTGVNSATWSTPVQHSGTDVIKGAWTKLSAYYTVPAGRDLMFPYFGTFQAAATSTNTYYIDDVTIREETETQNITNSLFGG